MTLADVNTGDPHVDAHNEERHAVNLLESELATVSTTASDALTAANTAQTAASAAQTAANTAQSTATAAGTTAGTAQTTATAAQATATSAATDAAEALANSGIAGPSGLPGPPGPIGNQLVDTVYSGTFNINPSSATDYTLIAAGNFDLAVSNMYPGQVCYVGILQDSTGGRVVTLPSTWIIPTSIVFDTTPNHFNVILVWRSRLGIHAKLVDKGAVPSTLWTPNNLSNQQGWFQADAIPLEPGDPVTSWPNSYNNIDGAVTGTPILRDLRGAKYVEFDGASYVDADGAAINAPILMGAVVRVRSNTGKQPLLAGVGGLDTEIYSDITSSVRSWRANGSGATTIISQINVWETVIVSIDNAAGIIRRDGSQVTANTGAKQLNSMRIGRGFAASAAYLTGDVAEMVIASKSPAGSDVADLENWLNQRRDQLNGV